MAALFLGRCVAGAVRLLFAQKPAFFKKFTPEEFRRDRFILVLLVGATEGILLYYYADNLIDYFKNINSPTWLGTLFTMLVAAPIALFIWSFRNADKREDLEQTQENLKHTEDTIRQTDFHKIEEWATTFPKVTEQKSKSADSTEPGANTENTNADKLKSNETKEGVLQVASIYQLLPYLKGEYGERFVRPTMEIYRSLLSSWHWSEEEQSLAEKGESYEIEKPPYIIALHTIFRQESGFFRLFHEELICKDNKWMPLEHIDLKGINLSEKEIARNQSERLISSKNSLEKVNLGGANLSGAILYDLNLFKANLNGAKLTGADLTGANLTGATYDEEEIKKAIMDKYTILKDGSRWKKPEGDPDQKSN